VHATGDPGDVMAALGQAGYAIIPDAIPAAQAAAARAELEAILETTPPGRDEFEGRRTRRVYAVFAKTRTLDTLALHPVVLGVLDQILGHYGLSAPAAIAIGPGQGHQPLHRDDAIYPIARPRPELVVNVMWPLTEFTEANGATRLVPGSHRWEDDKLPAQPPVRVAEMTPGSALIYTGSVWHGGGANTTAQVRLGVVLHYAAGWLRPVENHVLAVPPATMAALPTRLQELLGYNICPPFIGYVDGRHPRKLLTRPG
jgi:ectoine hydroxylase-related dioxygenase (phytanoyl-CoA dioxygenase family)